jgi:hypothetical protein
MSMTSLNTTQDGSKVIRMEMEWLNAMEILADRKFD